MRSLSFSLAMVLCCILVISSEGSTKTVHKKKSTEEQPKIVNPLTTWCNGKIINKADYGKHILSFLEKECKEKFNKEQGTLPIPKIAPDMSKIKPGLKPLKAQK